MKLLERLDGKRICVAVSGGADSVALLHYLKAQSSYYGFSLSAVHCQHGIRGQASLDDKAFVIQLCNEWNIPLFLFDEDCPMRAKDKKESLETTARNFRRESFISLIKKKKADYIATAHHLGDEAETVLLHLARGAGLSGARGIQPQSEFYIRPFLAWSKEQILAYIGEHGLSYRTDESNFCLDATRNKIRLQVLPLLEEIIPSAKENIAKFAQKALEDDTFLYALSDKLITRQGNAYLLSFHDEKPLFYRATLSVLKSLGLTQDYTTKHLESAYALQYLERGAKAHLPKNIRLEKTEKGILFTMQTEEPTIIPNNTEKSFTLDGFDGGRYAVKIKKRREHGEHTAPKSVIDFVKITKDVRECDRAEKKHGRAQFLPAFALRSKQGILHKSHRVDDDGRKGKGDQNVVIDLIERDGVHRETNEPQAQEHCQMERFVARISTAFGDCERKQGHRKPPDRA